MTQLELIELLKNYEGFNRRASCGTVKTDEIDGMKITKIKSEFDYIVTHTYNFELDSGESILLTFSRKESNKND